MPAVTFNQFRWLDKTRNQLHVVEQYRWKAGRQGTACHDVFGRQCVRSTVEIPQLPIRHIDCADAEPGGAMASQAFEIDQAHERLTQRICVVETHAGMAPVQRERDLPRRPGREESGHACHRAAGLAADRFDRLQRARQQEREMRGAVKKVRSCATRHSGGLPAMRAPLMAPIEVPTIQSGRTPSSSMAS